MLVLTSWDVRVYKFRLRSDGVPRVQIVIFWHLFGLRLMLSNLLTGSGGVFSRSEYRIRVNKRFLDEVRDLTVTRETGSPKSRHGMWYWET